MWNNSGTKEKKSQTYISLKTDGCLLHVRLRCMWEMEKRHQHLKTTCWHSHLKPPFWNVSILLPGFQNNRWWICVNKQPKWQTRFADTCWIHTYSEVLAFYPKQISFGAETASGQQIKTTKKSVSNCILRCYLHPLINTQTLCFTLHQPQKSETKSGASKKTFLF